MRPRTAKDNKGEWGARSGSTENRGWRMTNRGNLQGPLGSQKGRTATRTWKKKWGREEERGLTDEGRMQTACLVTGKSCPANVMGEIQKKAIRRQVPDVNPRADLWGERKTHGELHNIRQYRAWGKGRKETEATKREGGGGKRANKIKPATFRRTKLLQRLWEKTRTRKPLKPGGKRAWGGGGVSFSSKTKKVLVNCREPRKKQQR